MPTGAGTGDEEDEQRTAADEVAIAASVASCRTSLVTHPRGSTGGDASVIHTIVHPTTAPSFMSPHARNPHVKPQIIPSGNGISHNPSHRHSVLSHTGTGGRLMKWRGLIGLFTARLRPSSPGKWPSPPPTAHLPALGGRLMKWLCILATRQCARRMKKYRVSSLARLPNENVRCSTLKLNGIQRRRQRHSCS